MPFSEHSVLIDNRVYKVADLRVWRTLLLKTGPESYLFPTERETPLRRDNVWNRDNATS
jgi:hypothetical protein